MCLQGDEAMTSSIDEMYQAILDNKLPKAWRVRLVYAPLIKLFYCVLLLFQLTVDKNYFVVFRWESLGSRIYYTSLGGQGPCD